MIDYQISIIYKIEPNIICLPMWLIMKTTISESYIIYEKKTTYHLFQEQNDIIKLF